MTMKDLNFQALYEKSNTGINVDNFNYSFKLGIQKHLNVNCKANKSNQSIKSQKSVSKKRRHASKPCKFMKNHIKNLPITASKYNPTLSHRSKHKTVGRVYQHTVSKTMKSQFSKTNEYKSITTISIEATAVPFTKMKSLRTAHKPTPTIYSAAKETSVGYQYFKTVAIIPARRTTDARCVFLSSSGTSRTTNYPLYNSTISETEILHCQLIQTMGNYKFDGELFTFPYNSLSSFDAYAKISITPYRIGAFAIFVVSLLIVMIRSFRFL